MSDVLAHLKECLKTFGYNVEEIDGRLEFRPHTVMGRSYPCRVEEPVPHTNLICVSTLYFPPPKPEWDRKTRQKFSILFETLAERNGGGVYYRKDLMSNVVIEGTFISTTSAHDCLNLRRLIARIGRLRDFLDGDLGSIIDA